MSLVLGRREGEKVVINESIVIEVRKWKKGGVRLVIDAPQDVPIRRAEVEPRPVVVRS